MRYKAGYHQPVAERFLFQGKYHPLIIEYLNLKRHITMRNLLIILLATLTVAFQSCVPQRKFAEMESRKKAAEAESASMKAKNEQLEASLTESNSKLDVCTKQVEKLQADTSQLGKSYRQLRSQYDKINELNDILSNKNSQMLQFANEENKKLIADLNAAQEALQAKEDALKSLEKTVDAKQAAVDKATTELQDREARLQELEALLSAQKEASQALQQKVQQALLGFRDKGLTVTEKDGKVYVSMEAKLLFASGSTTVDPNGKKALVDLAKAIENEVDMEIIVEGHTDTDKINSSSIPRDNWELSVLRATEVIKIMTASSNVKPAVLTAAGRSEYHPVSSADKAKNRRIEIILQPNLSELYKIIEGQ
jgi:chemotaxis protein MotB